VRGDTRRRRSGHPRGADAGRSVVTRARLSRASNRGTTHARSRGSSHDRNGGKSDATNVATIGGTNAVKIGAVIVVASVAAARAAVN
jgi:hypothetical protein